MSKKKQLIPAIRFKALTHPWEQRKLEEDISVVGGATPSKSNPEYWNGSIVWLSSQEIKEKYVCKGTYTITKKAVDENTTKMVKAGTPLIVSRSGILARWFPISIPTTDVAINQDIKALIFDPNIINTNFFVAQLQKNEDFILRSIVKTGTTVQSVSMPDFYKLQLSFPSMDEQEKVGKFFQRLDDTIALHQRQLDNYKALKKVILQKIFNQELRFKDENGNEYPKWMRKTVNDIGDVVTGTTPSTKEKAYYNNGIYPWVTPTDIVQKNIDSTPRKLTEQGLSKGRMLPENTILVTCIASIGKNAILKQKGSCNQQINAIVCNKNHNYEFVYYLMEKNTDVLKSLAGKGTMDIVNKDVFSKMQVTVPCLEEQLRIGKFLSELDGKSEDEHKIVNLMKKEKQGLMQQMFV